MKIAARPPNMENDKTISYMAERVVGTGSFGVVFQAKCLEIGETVAIKKVLQDRRYKNRELQLIRTNHTPDLASRWIRSLAAHARRPFLERERDCPKSDRHRRCLKSRMPFSGVLLNVISGNRGVSSRSSPKEDHM